MTNRDTTFVAKHKEKRPLDATRLTWERMAYDKMYLTLYTKVYTGMIWSETRHSALIL